MRFILSLIISVGMIAILISCGDKSNNPIDEDPLKDLKERLAQTPREDREAEEAALWLSGDLVAPESLYQQLRSDFARLRDDVGDSLSLVMSFDFALPYEASTIMVKLADSAYLEFMGGNYSAWDSLNSLYRSTGPDTTVLQFWYSRILVMRFEGVLNSDSLVAVYDQVPGIEWVEPSGRGELPVNIVPWISGGETYFLVWEWLGDVIVIGTGIEMWHIANNQGVFEVKNQMRCDSIWACVPDAWWQEVREPFCRLHPTTSYLCGWIDRN